MLRPVTTTLLRRGFSRLTPKLAFAFDLDGVLMHDVGGKAEPLPHGERVLDILDELQIPYCFMTNSGGLTEQMKADSIGDILHRKLDASKFILAHTPLRDSPHFRHLHSAHVLACGPPSRCVKALSSYGFKHVDTPLGIARHHKKSFPLAHRDVSLPSFAPPSPTSNPSSGTSSPPSPSSPSPSSSTPPSDSQSSTSSLCTHDYTPHTFSGVIVMNDSADIATDTQASVDTLLSDRSDEIVALCGVVDDNAFGEYLPATAQASVPPSPSTRSSHPPPSKAECADGDQDVDVDLYTRAALLGGGLSDKATGGDGDDVIAPSLPTTVPPICFISSTPHRFRRLFIFAQDDLVFGNGCGSPRLGIATLRLALLATLHECPRTVVPWRTRKAAAVAALRYSELDIQTLDTLVRSGRWERGGRSAGGGEKEGAVNGDHDSGADVGVREWGGGEEGEDDGRACGGESSITRCGLYGVPTEVLRARASGARKARKVLRACAGRGMNGKTLVRECAVGVAKILTTLETVALLWGFVVMGKPQLVQYRSALNLLAAQAATTASPANEMKRSKASNGAGASSGDGNGGGEVERGIEFEAVWMVGDNPASDIAGAVRAGGPWKSALVSTGIVDEEQIRTMRDAREGEDAGRAGGRRRIRPETGYGADLLCDHVWEAVRYAIDEAASKGTTGPFAKKWKSLREGDAV